MHIPEGLKPIIFMATSVIVIIGIIIIYSIDDMFIIIAIIIETIIYIISIDVIIIDVITIVLCAIL